jgi:DeoR family transcriptional regulator, ulaG and ulaABCDEF operon transcriptional repressor
MHSAEREKLILDFLDQKGFVSFQDLERRMEASPATIRRDLERLMSAGLITRVRGGAKRADAPKSAPNAAEGTRPSLVGVPFHENIHRNRPQKEAIGAAAAKLCSAGEAVMIDGGSTTLQMCQHLAGLNLQVLTNSLHIVNTLLNQTGTRVLVPAGQVFREQNIILSAAGDDGMPRFHAPKLFMGAASLGAAGLMQADIILVAAERRLMDRADEIIVLVDSSKFDGPSGHVVCRLEEIDVVVTDAGIGAEHVRMLEKVGVKLVIARD